MLRWMEFASIAFSTGLAVKSTAVLGAGWLAGCALRRQSAATRHAAWLVTFVSLGALLLFSLTVPAVEVGVPAKMLDRAPLLGVVASTAAQTETDTAGRAQETAGMRRGGESDRPYHRPANDWRAILVSLWACGFLASLIPMAAGFATMLRMRRLAKPIDCHDELAVLARPLGLARVPVVLEGAHGSMPMTFGVWHPTIFLPRDARDWGEERRRSVLLHEMAHVARGDAATHLVARLLVSVYWWHPLAWTGWRELVKERERAVDDLVLRAGTRASTYAQHLLDIALAMRPAPGMGATAVAMARRSQLEGRLLALLDAQVKRGQPRRLAALGAAVLALALVVPLAAMRVIQAAPAQADSRGFAAGVTGQVDYGLRDLMTPLPADLDQAIGQARERQSHVTLDLLANKAMALRQFPAAQKLLEAALQLRGETAGEQSESYGIGLARLGNFFSDQGQNARSKELYKKALALLSSGAERAATLTHLGLVEVQMAGQTAREGNADLARQEYAEASAHFEQAGATDAAEAGQAAMWKAIVAQRQNDLANADAFYKQALAAQQGQPSRWLPAAAMYATFLQQTGKADEAKAILDQAAEIRKTVAPRVMLSDPAAKETAKIGGPVSPPQIELKVEPQYSQEARVAKYQGTVVTKVAIGTDGRVQSLSIQRGLGLGLDAKAAEAIVQWKFKPAEKGGLPVAVAATIEVNFRLL